MRPHLNVLPLGRADTLTDKRADAHLGGACRGRYADEQRLHALFPRVHDGGGEEGYL